MMNPITCGCRCLYYCSLSLGFLRLLTYGFCLQCIIYEVIVSEMGHVCLLILVYNLFDLSTFQFLKQNWKICQANNKRPQQKITAPNAFSDKLLTMLTCMTLEPQQQLFRYTRLYLQVPAFNKYPYLCITSIFLFSILAVTASAPTATLPSVLETLAVLLQAATLHAVAPRMTLLQSRARPMDLSILAAHAPAGLSAGLSSSIALAIFGLTIGLDASAANSAFGGHSFEQVIDFSVSWMSGQIRQSMALAGPRANVDAPRKLSSTQSMSNQHQREQVVALSFRWACLSRQRASSRFMPINYPLIAHLNPNGSKTAPHLQTHHPHLRDLALLCYKMQQKWWNSAFWKVSKRAVIFILQISLAMKGQCNQKYLKEGEMLHDSGYISSIIWQSPPIMKSAFCSKDMSSQLLIILVDFGSMSSSLHVNDYSFD